MGDNSAYGFSRASDLRGKPHYIADVFKTATAVSITAEATVWTPASGKRFRLLGMFLTASAAGNVTLRDNTAGTTIFVFPSATGGQGIWVDLGPNGIRSAAINNVLTAQLSVAGTLSGTFWGIEEGA